MSNGSTSKLSCYENTTIGCFRFLQQMHSMTFTMQLDPFSHTCVKFAIRPSFDSSTHIQPDNRCSWTGMYMAVGSSSCHTSSCRCRTHWSAKLKNSLICITHDPYDCNVGEHLFCNLYIIFVYQSFYFHQSILFNTSVTITFFLHSFPFSSCQKCIIFMCVLVCLYICSCICTYIMYVV